MFTHRHQDAVQVSWLRVVCRAFTQDRCQAFHARHSQDVNVVVAAEGLDKREVDLEGNVVFIFFVNGQKAKHYTVWVTIRRRKKNKPGKNVTSD